MFVHRFSPLQTAGQLDDAWYSLPTNSIQPDSTDDGTYVIHFPSTLCSMSPHYNLFPSIARTYCQHHHLKSSSASQCELYTVVNFSTSAANFILHFSMFLWCYVNLKYCMVIWCYAVHFWYMTFSAMFDSLCTKMTTWLIWQSNYATFFVSYPINQGFNYICCNKTTLLYAKTKWVRLWELILRQTPWCCCSTVQASVMASFSQTRYEL